MTRLRSKLTLCPTGNITIWQDRMTSKVISPMTPLTIHSHRFVQYKTDTLENNIRILPKSVWCGAASRTSAWEWPDYQLLKSFNRTRQFFDRCYKAKIYPTPSFCWHTSVRGIAHSISGRHCFPEFKKLPKSRAQIILTLGPWLIKWVIRINAEKSVPIPDLSRNPNLFIYLLLFKVD